MQVYLIEYRKAMNKPIDTSPSTVCFIKSMTFLLGANIQNKPITCREKMLIQQDNFSTVCPSS